jgi:hypothetical protein
VPSSWRPSGRLPLRTTATTTDKPQGVAELAGATVLHYDHDFEVIASVTGQAQEWVVPRGSVD